MTWLGIGKKCLIIAISLILVGCARHLIIAVKAEKEDMPILNREHILEPFENEDKYIIEAWEKIPANTFDVAKSYYTYKETVETPSFDGFYEWVFRNIWYKNKEDEFGIYAGMLENKTNNRDYADIKNSYELLKEMREK